MLNPRPGRMTGLAIACGAAALLAGPSALAEGPRLYLPDACVEEVGATLVLPLYLEGGEGRPTALRTTILFDPALLEPLETETEPAVRPGPALAGRNTQFSHEVDPDSGEISIVVNSAGNVPVPPLPEGPLAELRFRLRPAAASQGALRLDLDPGRTRSLDSDDREIFTATDRPAYIWIGQTGGKIAVGTSSKDGATQVAAQDMPQERQAWVVRGRSTRLSRRGGSVTFQETLPLGSAVEGRPVLDDDEPEDGEAFFYIVAQTDGSGRPLMSYGSGCRSRLQNTEVSRKD